MLTRVDPTLDRPVILFQNIIEVLHRSMSAVLLQSALGIELHDGWWIRGVAVGVDHPRRGIVRSAQRFCEKALGRDRVLLSREEKIQGRSARVHRPVEVTPLAFDPDVGLVHTPAVVHGASGDPSPIAPFDSNVIGLLETTKAFLPIFRANREGVIINISSVGGKMTFPLGTL